MLADQSSSGLAQSQSKGPLPSRSLCPAKTTGQEPSKGHEPASLHLQTQDEAVAGACGPTAAVEAAAIPQATDGGSNSPEAAAMKPDGGSAHPVPAASHSDVLKAHALFPEAVSSHAHGADSCKVRGDVSAAALVASSLIPRCTELLRRRQWEQCIQQLSTTEPLAGGRLPAVMQALAIANVHWQMSRRDWRGTLRLPPLPDTSGTRPDPGGNAGTRGDARLPAGQPDFVMAVRRQYRRMAALVHPDKCGLPHAEEAFRLLADAQAQLLDVSRGTKRPRRGNNSPAADPFDCGRWAEDEEDSGYAWWGAWEVFGRSGTSTTEPSRSQEEEALGELRGLPLEALRHEVAFRQAQVLLPAAASNGLSIVAKQQRLRAARSVLSSRLLEQGTRMSAPRWE